ncbi:MAG TPA: AAA family ATPase [Negativicutes bacterium]|nr:AAA family ATPase [Negativicutes bacterium]
MVRVIAVANQKGGVGKTTTAVNLSACLAELGKKVLLIDIDPQGNTTSGLGYNKYDLKQCVYDALINDVSMDQIIVPTAYDNLSLLPATIQLAGAEIELVAVISREAKLKRALDKTKHRFDYVIIDCPPSLGLLTINALTAAHSVLVPIQCEFYALEGLSQLMNSIQLVQKHLNPALALEGVVLTMFDARTNLSIQVVDEVKAHFRNKVYSTIIPRNVKLSEAPSHGLPIITYDAKSKGAEVYMELAKEVIGDE